MKEQDPKAIFSTTDIYPKLYFQSRGSGTIRLAFGCSEKLVDLESMTFSPNDDSIYGGFRFDGLGEISEEWKIFGKHYFFRPEIEMKFQSPGFVPPPTSKQIKSGPIWDEVNQEHFTYTSSVQKSLKEIRVKRLEKVVISARVTGSFDWHSDEFLGRAAGFSNHYVFCFQPDSQHAFFGVSPESLFCREGSLLQTEALAGTRLSLSASRFGRKESEEQNVVERSLAAAVDELCVEFKVEPIAPVLSGKLMHLRSMIRGKIKPECSDFDILSALHPTPAVAGYPRKESMAFIRRREEFDRGFFAGGVGFFGEVLSEMCVPIRSALWVKGKIYQYAGAGIVEGSDPESEWQEICAKFQALRQYL